MPIVAGCHAIVVHGSWKGKNVRVIEASKVAGRWICETSQLAVSFHESHLMRIDGYDPKMQSAGVDRLIGVQMSAKINKRAKK
jgi:hypothetical protein